MKTTGTENLKESINTANEKSAEMLKTFMQSSLKQFEANMDAGKAIFDTIAKQYSGKTEAKTAQQTENAKEGINNAVAAANKWLSQSSKIMMELYEKQFKFIQDSFKNFMDIANQGLENINKGEFNPASFHSGVELFLKNIENSSEISKKMFSGIIDSLTGKDDKEYVNEIFGVMLDTYKKQTEELMKFNKHLFDTETIKKTISLNKEISDKLQDDMERNLKASKKLMDSITDSYAKKAEFSPESGKKMLNEIFAEIDVVTKNNMKFWTNWFNEVYHTGKNGEKTTAASKNGKHS